MSMMITILYRIKVLSKKIFRGWSPRNTTSRKTTPIENWVRGTLPRIVFFGLADDVFYQKKNVFFAERARGTCLAEHALIRLLRWSLACRFPAKSARRPGGRGWPRVWHVDNVCVAQLWPPQATFRATSHPFSHASNLVCACIDGSIHIHIYIYIYIYIY